MFTRLLAKRLQAQAFWLGLRELVDACTGSSIVSVFGHRLKGACLDPYTYSEACKRLLNCQARFAEAGLGKHGNVFKELWYCILK